MTMPAICPIGSGIDLHEPAGTGILFYAKNTLSSANSAELWKIVPLSC